MDPPADFDWVGYYLCNPRIAIRKCSYGQALDHWIRIGSKQNLLYRQERKFNWKAYITRYPDLPANKITTEETALFHYIKYGRSEGRNPFRELPPSESFSFPTPSGFPSDRIKILLFGSSTDHNVKIYIERLIQQFDEFTFIIMRAEDHGKILSIEYQTQNYKSEILTDYTCIIRLIDNCDIKGIHIVDVMDFDLDKLSIIMREITTPYIITPFNWIDSKELFIHANEIIMPSQSSIERYKSIYPDLQMTFIAPEQISYGESRKTLQIGIDDRFLMEGIVKRCLDDIRERNLPLKIITDLSVADIIWLPIPLTQCYDYTISSIQCMEKLYVTMKTPLTSELSATYPRSYLYHIGATVSEINDLFILISNINVAQDYSTKRISMINSKYRTIYKHYFSIPTILSLKMDSITRSRFFVISSGKTGGSTLARSFLNALHLHSYRHLHACYDTQSPHSTLCLNDLYTYTSRKYVSPTTKEKILIVSGIRDPIGRAISAFFQNIESYLTMKPRDILLMSIPTLILIFNNRFLSDIENYYPFWDPDEPLLNGYAGRDLFQIPFNYEKKRLFFEDETFRILILRFEDISGWDSIIRSTLPEIDLMSYSFKSENLSEMKWYSDLYRRFLAEYTVPRSLLDAKFDHPYHRQVLEHFYSPEEIDAMKQKWYAKAT